jgi:hypothetical protein
MRDGQPARGASRRYLREREDDLFEGKAVEAIAPDAFRR